MSSKLSNGNPGPRRLAWALLLGLMGLTGGVFLPAAISIPFDFSVDRLFQSDSPEIERARQADAVFPPSDREFMVVVQRPQGWFDTTGLKAFADLHQRLEQIPIRAVDREATESTSCQNETTWNGKPTHALERFASIRQIQLVDGEGEQAVLQRAWPADGAPPEAKDFKARLLKDRLTAGKLLSTDGDTLLIRAQLVCGIHEGSTRLDYLETIRAVTQAWQAPLNDVHVILSGLPFIQDEVIESLRGDFITLQPITIIVMLGLLVLAFGSLRAAMLPFLATLFGCIWCLGLMALVGEAINVVNFAITVVILVIGAGDGIHIVARYQEELEVESDSWLAMKATLKPMLLACGLTTATTLIGFLSLRLAKVEMIKSFGLWAAIGVGVTWIFTMVMIPSLMLIIGVGKPQRSGLGRWLEDEWLPKLAKWVLQRRTMIMVVSLSALLIGLATASQLTPFSRALEEFPHDHPARANLQTVEDKLTGVLPFTITVEGPRDLIFSPETLKEMAAIQDELETKESGISTFALTDLVSALHSHWEEGRQGSRQDLPSKDDQLASLLATLKLSDDADLILSPLLYDPRPPAMEKGPESSIEGDEEIVGFDEEDDFEPADQDPQEALNAETARATLRINGLKHDSGSTQWRRIVPWLQDRLKMLPEGVTAEIGGSATIVNQAIHFVVTDLLKSLLFAFVLITLLMGLLMRSARVGFAAMVPNVIPLVLTMAVMVLVGIHLRISTVITFAMCMGIVVDDSIHFLVRWREERSRSQGDEEGMLQTIRFAGRPVIFTTVMLGMGFAVLITSTFRGLHDFGVLAVITISLALIADLVILPALLLGPQKSSSSR
ncbi:MAG: hypothetical protein CMH58_04175 [Myxococcales bacterium]|nr:hypothetical protein [Myxococcales bacterium]